MSKKKANKKAQPQTPATMTKRQLTRWQREQRQQRLALIFVVGTIVAVVGIILFGLWREVINPPNEVVASVGQQKITLSQMATAAKYRAKVLDQQIAQTNSEVQQLQAQAASDPTSEYLVQLYQQQLQQLQLERLQLDQAVLDDMIGQQLVRDEMLRRGLTVSKADIDAAIQEQFQPQPDTAGQTITDTASLTQTTNVTPTPSPTAIPPDAWQARYDSTLRAYGLTDAEFRRYTMEPSLNAEKLQAAMGITVPTTTEQVHASHILLATEAEANDTLALLKEANTDFAELAKARSTDTSNKEEGGDLGWFGRGTMDPAFEAAAFALQPNQISDVISTTFGYHIIKMLERDANRPLTASELEEKTGQVYNQWLTTAKESAIVQRFFDSAKQQWLSKQIPAAQF